MIKVLRAWFKFQHSSNLSFFSSFKHLNDPLPVTPNGTLILRDFLLKQTDQFIIPNLVNVQRFAKIYLKLPQKDISPKFTLEIYMLRGISIALVFVACVASVSNPLPLSRHSCFFCSCPSFLDEPCEETLATQAMVFVPL